MKNRLEKPIYFTLEELLTSSTARQKSIENLPSWNIVENLAELGLFLDEIRKEWGSGIRVTSGYRNEKLNVAVGGVLNSCHRLGYAADIVPSNGKFDEFVEFLKVYLKNKAFDQCIIETSKKTKGRWVHLAIYSPTGLQRRRIFNLEAK